jgi:glycosyltransferase involved in cell wall biosynthesis
MKSEIHAPKCIILLPVYNVEKSIDIALNLACEAASEITSRYKHRVDILVLYSPSKDRTLDIIKTKMEKDKRIAFHSSRKKGLDQVLKEGYQISLKGDYSFILRIDADLEQNQREVITKIFDSLFHGGNKFVVANRNFPDYTSINPVEYQLLSLTGKIVSWMSKLEGLMEPSSGNMGFSREALLQIMKRSRIAEWSDIWALDCAVILQSRHLKYPREVVQVSGCYQGERRPADKVFEQYALFFREFSYFISELAKENGAHNP